MTRERVTTSTWNWDRISDELDAADPRPKVYMVITGEYPEDYQTVGVFFSEDAAKDYIARNKDRFVCPFIEEEVVLDGAGTDFMEQVLYS